MVEWRVNGFECWLFPLYSVTIGKSIKLIESLLLIGRINESNATHPRIPFVVCLAH